MINKVLNYQKKGLELPMAVYVAKKTLMRVVEGARDVVLGSCGNGHVAQRGLVLRRC